MGGDTPTKHTDGVVEFNVINEAAVSSEEEAIHHVLFQVKTGESKLQVTTRAPIELVLVLDQSGSMRGEKIAQAKKAVQSVIENLSLQDTVHFITYNHESKVVFKNAHLKTSNKDLLLRKVAGVNASGATNMLAALRQAEDVLKSTTNLVERNRRVFLFSDGLVPQRTISVMHNICATLLEKDVLTTTFGIGDDFNEELMQGLSESGGGNYFFVDEDDRIEHYVSGALKSLMVLCGKKANLTVKTLGDTVLENMYGADDVLSCGKGEQAGRLIGDLKQSNVKNILCKFLIDPSGKKGESVDIAEYTLSYISVNGEEDESEKKVCFQGKLSVRIDTEGGEKEEEVAMAILTQEGAYKEAEALRLLEEGKIEEAIKVKESEIKMYQVPTFKSEKFQAKVSQMVEQTNDTYSDMKSQPTSKKVRKKMKYRKQLKRMDSADYMFM